jgi:FkbM family methyltransferase
LRGFYWSVKLRLTEYEPETQALRRLVSRGAVCIDVGGNFGQFASYLARTASPTGFVHSFEPLAYNRRVFESVIRHMGLRNVSVYPFAVGSRPDVVRLWVPDRNTAEAHISGSGEELVEVIPLDAWASKANLTRLDFLKIDVEGFELEVLRGASDLLSHFRPALLCEISGVSESRYGVAAIETFRFLESRGYRAYTWRDVGLVAADGPRADVINYFFVHGPKGPSVVGSPLVRSDPGLS